MPRRAADRLAALVAGLALVLLAPAAHAQGTDALLARVRQLVNGGNRAGARAAADSALVIRTEGTVAYAEALYARGFASDAAGAERDYLRVSIEYPFSPYAEDAILMVGTLREARGDRAGARRQYERLATEYPRSLQAARAGYNAGRLALDDGDTTVGCTFLFRASERVGKEDVELRNQVEYLRQRCMVPAPAPTAPATDTATKAPPPGPPAVRETPKGEYSVQVAAYPRKKDADAAAARLKKRGFAVRVVGTKAPFRVRVGRYASRAEAVAALGRMKQAKVSGIVVDAEPR